MTNPLKEARHLLLDPAGLTDNQLQKVLSKVLGGAVDYADLYFQMSHHESWVLEDGVVKSGSYNVERGVGVRAISGEKTGFAYSDDIILPGLSHAATAASSIAQSGREGTVKAWSSVQSLDLYPSLDPLGTLTAAEKIALLQKLDAEARRIDPRVEQVVVSLASAHDVVLVMNSDGELGADIRPLVRLNVSVIIEDKGRREQGFAGGGARSAYQFFSEEDRDLEYAREAVRLAIVNLDAVPAPAGTMPVVLGPGWPGILLHEAVGHGLEGDFNRKGVSAFSGRLGERVATPECTVIDDGTIAGRRGSLNMDDEGTPTGTLCPSLPHTPIPESSLRSSPIIETFVNTSGPFPINVAPFTG